MKNQAGMGLFGLALLSFILPWVDIRCGEQTIARFAGLDLLTGKEMGGELGRSDPNLWVIGAAVLLVIGLLLYLLKKPAPAAIFGWVSAGALIGFVVDMHYALNRKAAEQGGPGGETPDLSGMVSAEYQIGYFLCLILSLAGALVPQLLDRLGKGEERKEG